MNKYYIILQAFRIKFYPVAQSLQRVEGASSTESVSRHIGLFYWPASLCGLATQFQTLFLESIPRPIAGLKFPTLSVGRRGRDDSFGKLRKKAARRGTQR